MHDTPSTPAAPARAPDSAAALPAELSEAQQGDEFALQLGAMRVPLHVNARGMALGILATIAFVFALQWAQKFFVPLLLGILLAYTINPVVLWLERWRIPRVIGATLVTVAIVSALGGTVYRLQGEFFNIIDELPTLTSKVTRIFTNTSGQRSTLQQMQAAAAEIERAASHVGDAVGASSKRLPPKPAPEASGASSPIRIMDWVLAGSVGLATFLSQTTMVVFLVYFLLLAGDTFKRKMVKLTGPSLSQKKVTVHILDDINTSIQSYMFMLLVTNVLLGLLMWVAFRFIGLENAGAWAAFSGVAHLMPYFGPLVITIATGLAAFLQFESVTMAMLVAGTSMVIATLVGMVVATWMTGKIARMNPTAVFVSLLFWGWLWGVWGLLLGVPVVMVVKVVAERVDGMQAIAELLGE